MNGLNTQRDILLNARSREINLRSLFIKTMPKTKEKVYAQPFTTEKFFFTQMTKFPLPLKEKP